MEKKKNVYKVRAFLGKDVPEIYKNLIYARWLRTLRYGNEYFYLIDSDTYYKTYKAYIDQILQRPDTVVRLALLDEDEDIALGFSISEVRTLHYCHVQVDTRNQGVGTSLIPFKIETITHLTKHGLNWWNKSFPTAKFNPFK